MPLKEGGGEFSTFYSEETETGGGECEGQVHVKGASTVSTEARAWGGCTLEKELG